MWPRPSVDACARCAAENASLTQISPSFASSATNAGSFFSSSMWKRVFSRQRTSPSFIALTAFSATSPTQSSAKATGLLITWASAAATGFSQSLAALVGNFSDGRRDALEPGGIGDAAVLHGHVEIDAQQHALALHVDVIEGAECFGH